MSESPLPPIHPDPTMSPVIDNDETLQAAMYNAAECTRVSEHQEEQERENDTERVRKKAEELTAEMEVQGAEASAAQTPPAPTPKITSDPRPLPNESKAEPPPPQDQCLSTTNLPMDPERKAEGREERKEESKRDTAGFGELRRQRREIELKGLVKRQRAEISMLREVGEQLKGRVGRREDRILQLEYDLERIIGSWREAENMHARRALGMQERLKQTEQLLEARSAELSGAQAFLSTADRLSEMEVLDIVHELNENIYQVAAGLTEEWMKLESSEPTDKKFDPTSQPRPIILVQLARNRDLTGLTFLLQLYLCRYAVSMTSTWVYREDFAVIKDVYHHLSASEGQAVSARWRSLTHSYLSKQPPNAVWIADQMAEVLGETGSFASLQQSSELVQNAALERIESMIQTAQRLERAFMVDITSSDMSLFFETPGSAFDDARMINEFGADSVWKPGRRGKIAGTTEVGVRKSVCKKPGEPRHVEILLKPKVVLEKDVVGDGKQR